MHTIKTTLCNWDLSKGTSIDFKMYKAWTLLNKQTKKAEREKYKGMAFTSYRSALQWGVWNGRQKGPWGGVGRIEREFTAFSFLPNALVSHEHLCLFDFCKFILWALIFNSIQNIKSSLLKQTSISQEVQREVEELHLWGPRL